jgi:putative MATE family efflux protein
LDRAVVLSGNLWRVLLRFSVPGIAGMLLLSVNGLTDALYVSRLIGPAAFTGVSLALPLLVVNMSVTSLVSSGASILYSRMIGAGEGKTVVNSLLQHVFFLVVLGSLVLAAYYFATRSWLLQWLGASGGALEYGKRFFAVACLGYLPSMLGLCISGLIRAGGNMKTSMRITAVTVVLNVVLNPILIIVFKMGTAGAAWASVIAMSVYALLTVLFFTRYHGCFRMEGPLQWKQIREILLTGLPALFMQLNGVVRQFILFKLVTTTADNQQQIAYFAAVYRLFSFMAVPVFGILQALQPVLGINYGAGQLSRVRQARRIFWSGALALMAVMVTPVFLFPTTVLGLLADPASLHSVPAGYFQQVLIVLLLMPAASTSIVMLQATGQRRLASYFTFGREPVLFIPVLLLSAHLWGYYGVYYGLLLENTLYCLLLFAVSERAMAKLSVAA